MIRSLTAPGALVVGALLIAAPAPAHATTLSGLARLTPTGPAASSLARQGVTITPRGDAESANVGQRTAYVLPAGDSTFAATTRLKLGGSLLLRRKRGGRTRSVRLGSLQVRLGTKSRVVTAKVGRKRIDVFTLDLRKSEYTADAASTVIRIEGTRALLTRRGADAIGRALGLKTRRSGTFGVLAVTASAPVTSGSATTPSGIPSSPGTTAPAGAGTTTPSGVAYTPPTALARPAGAVDVASSALRWHVRESFVRYLRSGEGVTASAGATAGAPAGDGVIYDYDFSPAGGWYDPATGQGHLNFKGLLHFSYSGHGIDIRLSDPQIELNGTGSRMLATFTSAKASGFSGLAEFASLDLAAAQTTGSAPPLIVRSAIPVRVTGWSNEVIMGGFYPAPDDLFGQLNVSFTPAA